MSARAFVVGAEVQIDPAAGENRNFWESIFSLGVARLSPNRPSIWRARRPPEFCTGQEPLRRELLEDLPLAASSASSLALGRARRSAATAPWRHGVMVATQSRPAERRRCGEERTLGSRTRAPGRRRAQAPGQRDIGGDLAAPGSSTRSVGGRRRARGAGGERRASAASSRSAESSRTVASSSTRSPVERIAEAATVAGDHCAGLRRGRRRPTRACSAQRSPPTSRGCRSCCRCRTRNSRTSWARSAMRAGNPECRRDRG